MHDLTQFVVSTIAMETHTEHLLKLFMENCFLSFGMVMILVVDTDSRFKIVFKDMCASLAIIYWPLAPVNNKVMSIVKYHRFLNKTQEIAGQDRGMHDVFLLNAKTSHYSWNSAPIDGTDILRSVAAVRRKLWFR